MNKSVNRIEVYYMYEDIRGMVLMQRLNRLGLHIEKLCISDNYLLNHNFTKEQLKKAADSLVQPVTQKYSINTPFTPDGFDYSIEIGFLPGVTDNVSHTVRESIEDLLNLELDREKSVFTTITYFIKGPLSRENIETAGNELYNPLIQRIKILSRDEYIKMGGMGNHLPVVKISDKQLTDEIDLNVPDDELVRLGKEGIPEKDGTRRGPLALDFISLDTIRNYFNNEEKRNPTDIELESIAQTWSEHCKHTIFAADMDDDVVGGIYKKYIKEATLRIRREKGDRDFCLSVFSDNAGGIEFDDDYIIADKVETHNSPSALDPFGGSITGIVGVNRDIIGFGIASKPVANRYGFCFANPFDDRPLYRSRDRGSMLMPPRRIMDGVVHGVNVGGNQSGIPTPQGFVFFDDRYKGKPLVFVGTLGLIPKTVNGKSTVEKKAMNGDLVVMVGGKVGRDGIHGATFSSEALTSGSPATAVQIGDPITQKKLSDTIVKEARDMGLYNSITDNGAGGLSCSVAEMARESGGFQVNLEKIPLKYSGLSPWQVWVSESQERMTLAVPPENIEAFITLMNRRGVEASVIGSFTDGNRGIVKLNGEVIFDLDMTFLHDGLPRKKLSTSYTRRDNAYPDFDIPEDMNSVMHDMMNRLNICSYDFISCQYDHEVQGNSVIKPIQGKGKVNGNTSVIRPLLDSGKGVALSQGAYPLYSDIDTYHMAACSIDTAVRNIIAAGGTLDRIALLDNFCWCDSNNPERLGQLKEAARACYDYSVAYGTPFISGKDSMFNDFKGYDDNFNEVFISVPPTLLISSTGVVEDINRCISIDFKFPGNLICVLGLTSDETGGSEYLSYMGEKLSGSAYLGNNVPRVDAEEFARLYRAFEKAVEAGAVSSAISIERGGLGVALAKASLAGELGCEVDMKKPALSGTERIDTILFSESQGRILLSLDPSRIEELQRIMEGLDFSIIGRVKEDGRFKINSDNNPVIDTGLPDLMNSYRNRFNGF